MLEEIYNMQFNPLPVQFKSLLPGQEGCVFFSPQQQTNIPTWISITYFDAYAWIVFMHVQICLLSDFITSGNIELLFVRTAQYIYKEDSQCVLVRLGWQAEFKFSTL
jgi:hypothetical protein